MVSGDLVPFVWLECATRGHRVFPTQVANQWFNMHISAPPHTEQDEAVLVVLKKAN
jgi:hypothetical protein